MLKNEKILRKRGLKGNAEAGGNQRWRNARREFSKFPAPRDKGRKKNIKKELERIELELSNIYWELRENHYNKEANRLDTIIGKIQELQKLLKGAYHAFGEELKD